MTIYAKDQDDLYGDSIVCAITISVRRNGSMSVSGNINDEAYSMAMLDAAKQSLKNHHARMKIENGKGFIMPSYDNPISGTNLEKSLYDSRGNIANKSKREANK